MTDKLDELLVSVQQHIKDKKAELQALETQVFALHSAHEDLRKQISISQEHLADARKELTNFDADLNRRSDEAQKIAGDVIDEAHDELRRAHKVLAQATGEAADIVGEAAQRAKAIEKEVAARKAELQVVLNELNAGHSQVAALKKQCRDFADS